MERTTEAAVFMRNRYSLQSEFLGSNFFLKCRILSGLWRNGLERRETKILLRRLLPRPLLLRFRLARAHLATLPHRPLRQNTG